MSWKHLLRLGVIAAATLGSLAGVRAQDFPSRPITIVVPYPPGASFDLAGRLLADVLGRTFGQRVVVDNKPGAGGIIAANFAAFAARRLHAAAGVHWHARHSRGVAADPL